MDFDAVWDVFERSDWTDEIGATCLGVGLCCNEEGALVRALKAWLELNET